MKSVLVFAIEREKATFQVLEPPHVHLDCPLLDSAGSQAMRDPSHMGVFAEQGHEDPPKETGLLVGKNLLDLPDLDVVLEVDVEVFKPLIKLI